MMEDQTEPSRNAPRRRRFVLTPLPEEAEGGERLGGKGRLRRTLVVGGAVVPVALTIRGRSALANGASCPTLSVPLSATNSAAAGTYATKCAYTPAVWTTYLPQLQGKVGSTGAYKFPQQQTDNFYLADPDLSTILTVPAGSSGVSLSFEGGNKTLSDALGGSTVLRISFDFKGHKRSYDDNVGGLAQAVAAVLNAAYFGAKYLGTTDAEEIPVINGYLATLLSDAETVVRSGTKLSDIEGTLQSTINSVLTSPLESFNAQ